jgi:uncharacterized damage-inducible protein DinB
MIGGACWRESRNPECSAIPQASPAIGSTVRHAETCLLRLAHCVHNACMADESVFAALFRYSDRANAMLLDAAMALDDERLDRAFDMGMGSLRRTLLHIWSGESVWLQRWQGRVETPWPDERERAAIRIIADRLAANSKQRDQFLAGLATEALATKQTYRDSKGSLFSASLQDMVLQMFVHSAHHRAQAVNMLRRLGVTPPEVDYMMQVRTPA